MSRELLEGPGLRLAQRTVTTIPIDFSLGGGIFCSDLASLLGQRSRAGSITGDEITRRAMTKTGSEDTVVEADRRLSALMAAAQAGDGPSYQTLLRDCVPVIKSVARRRGVPADRVDDVVQDVLLTIHRARQTYDPRRSFTAWISVITERRAIDLLRRTRRLELREVHAPLEFESHTDETADLGQGIARAEASGTVARALESLPPRQREAVQHLVLEERSLADAAALTRRSKGSLKVNLHRALKALRGGTEPRG
jgi:RNA polymerase sigma factor (sigma-70 family)